MREFMAFNLSKLITTLFGTHSAMAEVYKAKALRLLLESAKQEALHYEKCYFNYKKNEMVEAAKECLRIAQRKRENIAKCQKGEIGKDFFIRIEFLEEVKQ